MRKIEVCCGNLRDAIEAQEGGAERIELCSALEVGGLTPSYGLVKAVQEMCPRLPVNVIIRPRGGDFVYDGEEVAQMLLDIIQCRLMRVHGVVIGALTPAGDIDLPVCRLLVKAARGVTENLHSTISPLISNLCSLPSNLCSLHSTLYTLSSIPSLSVTFHRAFDVCRDPRQALEDIVSLGCDRLLTSGQRATALQGAENIASYVRQAAGRIIIMPGCGVNPDNIAEIEHITAAGEFHSTARGASFTNQVHTNPHVDFDENQPQRRTSRSVIEQLL